MSTFKSRLPKQYNEDVTASFFVGTVAGGRWHVDTSRDVRAIVNLSATPVGLAVATDWNPTDYGKARSKYDYYAFEGAANPPEPKSSKVILYNPGEAIGVINLARADRQVPHKAIACPGRVVLRLSQLVH